jgi:hypothetical protein
MSLALRKFVAASCFAFTATASIDVNIFLSLVKSTSFNFRNYILDYFDLIVKHFLHFTRCTSFAASTTEL